MNAGSLSDFWLQMLGLLAIETGLIASLLLLVLRRSSQARWRRTFCQAAVIATLVVGLGELSGTSRRLARWMAIAASPIRAADSSRGDRPLELNPAFVSDVNDRRALLPTAVFQGSPAEALGAPSIAPTVNTAPRSSRNDAGVPPGLCILAIWVAGIAVVGGRVCLVRCLFVLFRSRRRIVADPALLGRIRVLSGSLRISRRIRVIESGRLTSPIAFGVLRPTIGLPLNFTTAFGVRQQDVMLVHELAHLATRDPIWYLLADLATALFWWHPAVWWMRRQLQLASEWAADEASLLVESGPCALAECLVALGARLTGPAVMGQLRIEGFRSNLGCRVQRLMNLENRGWIPPRRLLTVVVQWLGPIALTATLIVCTAWALPRAITEGETMKNIPLNWKRSLAALGLIVAATADDRLAGAEAPDPATVPPTSTQTSAARQTDPASDAFRRRYGLSAAPAAGAPVAANARRTPAGVPADPASEAFRQRYGLSSTVPALGPAPQAGASAEPETRRSGSQLEAKLKQIVLEEVRFDGLPLSEVVSFLSQEARKRDPDKKGVNFLLNPNLPLSDPYIDSTTGLPVASPPEPFDPQAVIVNLSHPLRNITMFDLIGAIVKVADRPIEYTLEDYAVVFSPRRAVSGRVPRTAQTSPEALIVCTFKVDTNTFVGGLESAFGIQIDTSAKGGGRARKIQTALNELLTQLGILVSGNKSVFYNELTGIVMVRATYQDLQVVRAAIETLGGAVHEQGPFWPQTQ
jgi:beta-lactamase regulating signal transducer with metallopeptidase domain